MNLHLISDIARKLIENIDLMMLINNTNNEQHNSTKLDYRKNSKIKKKLIFFLPLRVYVNDCYRHAIVLAETQFLRFLMDGCEIRWNEFFGCKTFSPLKNLRTVFETQTTNIFVERERVVYLRTLWIIKLKQNVKRHTVKFTTHTQHEHFQNSTMLD